MNQTRDEKSTILMIAFSSNLDVVMFDHELNIGWAPVEDDTRWNYLMKDHVEVQINEE